MKRPKQLPAVDRRTSKCASVPVGANVGASFNWESLIPVATNVLSGIL